MLQVLGGTYVFQYRYDGNRIVMLRVFHGREALDCDIPAFQSQSKPPPLRFA